ncbi:MAG: DUF3842 family protein [Eubacteriales bacterium]|nr:DUF3842 family protein [Eubacteriales bacterium]
MYIAVVDGQGGGMGKSIVEKLRQVYGADIHILALGTNSLATAAMIKAGANQGATGESAIVHNAYQVDVIMGPIGIVCAYAFLGELSPAMAKAIAESKARKILIPLDRCNVQVAGIKSKPLPQLIDDAVAMI